MTGNPGATRWSLAIDFGTTNTAAAMVVHDSSAGGTPVVLEIDGSRYLPSVVYRDDSGQLFTGRTAVRQAAVYPERAERVPKRALVVGDTVVLGGAVVAVTDLVAAILDRVYSEAVRYQGGSGPSAVILTHPARWTDTELGKLRDAATKAGITDPVFVSEPVAAAWFYARPAAGAVTGVFDLGGGTLDVAVLRSDGRRYTVAGPPGGDPHLGGEDFDDALLGKVESLGRARDAALWSDVFETGRQARRDLALLRTDVTMAKEALSDRMTFDLAVPGYPDEFRLTRSEFQDLIGDAIDGAAAETQRTISAAGLTPADLSALYLTGGSSRIPFVASRLASELGVQPELRDDPKTVVVLGALAAESAGQGAGGTGVAVVRAELDPDARRQLLTEAERIARDLSSAWYQAATLLPVARALAPIDQDAARQLLDEAAAMTRPWSGHHRALILSEAADQLVSIDPDQSREMCLQAKATLEQESDKDNRARDLAQVAHILSATDFNTSRRMIVETEAWARRCDRPAQDAVLGSMSTIDLYRAEQYASALGENDLTASRRIWVNWLAEDQPDRAEQVAREITNPEVQADALCRVAAKLDDPARRAAILADVESHARGLTEERKRIQRLLGIAGLLATTHPDHAKAILADAESDAKTASHLDLLCDIAALLAIVDTVAAERMFADLEPLIAANQATLRVKLATGVALVDPGRAERLARAIPPPYQESQDQALVSVTRELAKTDDFQAELIIVGMTYLRWKVEAWTSAASVLAASNPNRALEFFAAAEAAARTMGSTDRHNTLISIAKTMATTATPD